ncbi:MAG TPA: ABC transporter permease, partial [Agriterribacter sp.]|nr:ABC transporter permease [Agriterribacter sp.]
MFRNFFIIAWRNLLRKKSFSLINVSGLSIGMAAAILILLWIQNERSYDQFHENKDRIYKAWNRYKIEGKTQSWSNTPQVMGPAIQQDYPEVERTARVSFFPPVLISVGDKRLTGRGSVVDSSFLQMFSFPLLKGNPANALDGVYDIVLTETLAKKIFGNEDPIGKIIKIDNSDNFTVTAVVKDRPVNTQFDFEFLLSWAYWRKKGWEDQNWSNNSIDTYVMLKSGASLAGIEPKIKDIRKKYDSNDPLMETFLYPLTRHHLYGSFENGKEAGGRIEIVRLFGIIAAFILLVACINFMNLSTARSEKRAKEVCIRKVVGAQKKSLIAQFLGESILLAVIASIFALLIVQLTLPYFNGLVAQNLGLHYNQVDFWIAGIVFILLTGIVAGSYPAVFLSSFKPVRVLKGQLKAGSALVTPRKVLVIAQFTFAIALIIATIIVRQQIQKAQDRQAGYSKNNLLYHFMEGDVEKNYALIKNELLNSGVALSVTKTSAPVTEGWSNTWGIEWQGKKAGDKTVIDRFCADDAFAKTTGLQIVQGRDLDLSHFNTDSTAALLNETAVKVMGFEQPIGQVIKDMGQEWHVVGVVKDFILRSPYHPITPIFISGAKGWFNVIHIKLNDQYPTNQNIASLKTIFKKYNPEYPFNYRFVDEEYAKKFDDEKRTGKLASLFSFLTIIISCLGLFGLSSYMAENRVKEIGVRKVLGASVPDITTLLTKDFLKLVGVAIVIASPLAYWAMHKWLQGYPYRVAIQWWVFAAAGLAAILIALLTVSFQAIKAAIANPVESLRTE